MREIKFRAWDQANERFWSACIWMGKDWALADDRPTGFPVTQYTGLKDKNGKEIYEGDLVRHIRLEIEYQTHYGDNIPTGSYTEPCGIIAKYETGVVNYCNGEFTILEHGEEDEGRSYNWLRHFEIYDRERINYIFFPHYDEQRSQQYSDEEFAETMKDVGESLNIEPKSIEEFINMVNGIEVIGNIYETPELITPSNKTKGIKNNNNKQWRKRQQ